MKQIAAIAKFTVIENISNKIFNGFILFALLVIFGTAVMKDISLYEEVKVIKDTGIFLTEFFVLLMTIFTSSTQFLKDKKEKSIYLVLTKPVTRGMYITGKLAGIIITVFFNVLFMAIVLAIVVVWQKGIIDIDFILSFLFIFYKLSIVAGIGVLFSVLSDSFITANLFTFSIYVAAHGDEEIRLIANKVLNPILKVLTDIIYYTLPNFRALNYRDYIVPIDDIANKTIYSVVKPDILMLTLYSAGFAMILGALASFIFSKKKI